MPTTLIKLTAPSLNWRLNNERNFDYCTLLACNCISSNSEISEDLDIYKGIYQWQWIASRINLLIQEVRKHE